MSCEAPASLTGSLLVKKGNAAPASYGLASIASLVQHAREARKLFPVFGSAEDAPSGPLTAPKASARRRKPRQPDARARLSLRVDDERYLRLQRLCADRQLSRQHVLTEALDGYLEEIAPSIADGRCACLAAGRPAEAAAP